MITQPAPIPPNPSGTPPPASPASSARTGRLRGLGYLRNYTQNHRLSLSGHASSTSSQIQGNQQSSTTPTEGTSSRVEQDGSPDRLTGYSVDRSVSPSGTASTTGWLPTVGGHSGLSRFATEPQPTSSSVPPVRGPRSLAELGIAPAMGRPGQNHNARGVRSAVAPTYSAAAREFARLDPQTPVAVSEAQASTETATPGPPTATESAADQMSIFAQMPSIRFTSHQDPRASRPSLEFAPISRTLPTPTAIIRVGRYSEKDAPPQPLPNSPSSAPVGFKSKVVSRKHCEFWCHNGQWYIRDVKSSSGTFLNHIRLSQPTAESRPWPVNDGDVVQLGIDFKGGEEMIFRCVKIRIECNRGWQKGLNNFNTTTHLRLRNLAAMNLEKMEGDGASTTSSECSICLYSIAPCQSLFVAPCSHVWHYKCIRPILNAPTYPQFLCPNCRAVTDLDAEVEEPSEDWESQVRSVPGSRSQEEDHHIDIDPPQSRTSDAGLTETSVNDDNTRGLIRNAEHGTSNLPLQTNTGATIRSSSTSSNSVLSQHAASAARLEDNAYSHGGHFRSTSRDGSTAAAASSPRPIRIGTPVSLSSHPDGSQGDGPLTPRNDAGPFVFDGSAGNPQARERPLANLDEAAAAQEAIAN